MTSPREIGFDNLRNHYRGRYYKYSQFFRDCQEVCEHIRRCHPGRLCVNNLCVEKLLTHNLPGWQKPILARRSNFSQNFCVVTRKSVWRALAGILVEPGIILFSCFTDHTHGAHFPLLRPWPLPNDPLSTYLYV